MTANGDFFHVLISTLVFNLKGKLVSCPRNLKITSVLKHEEQRVPWRTRFIHSV